MLSILSTAATGEVVPVRYIIVMMFCLYYYTLTAAQSPMWILRLIAYTPVLGNHPSSGNRRTASVAKLHVQIKRNGVTPYDTGHTPLCFLPKFI